MADVEEVRVRGGECFATRARHLSGDAIGEAHFAPAPVVVAGAKLPDRYAERGVHDQAIEQAELRDIERCFLLIRAGDTHEVIEHLGHPQSSQ